MLEKTKTVYYCEFCGKHYIHKGYAVQKFVALTDKKEK